jgi:hypothetical protein
VWIVHIRGGTVARHAETPNTPKRWCSPTKKGRDDAAPYPGFKTIARRMGITETAVRHHARKLERKGFLWREKQVGTTNRFHLSLQGTGGVEAQRRSLGQGRSDIRESREAGSSRAGRDPSLMQSTSKRRPPP